MTLEEKLTAKKITVQRLPPDEVLAQVERGNKFIMVDETFQEHMVPIGYTLIDMRYRENSFKTLIPQSLLFYMANPGEGDTTDALDEIADFYGEAEEIEDDFIENGKTSVQEANWATLARESYGTYLINQLVKHKRGTHDKEGEPIPEFDEKVISSLDLHDDYVAQRAKAIAAVVLGKTVDEVKRYGLEPILIGNNF